MAWQSPATWSFGASVSSAQLNGVSTDIRTWGGNVDAGSYALTDAAGLYLNPGVLPATAFSVSAASWTGGTATLTIGAHSIQVGQHVVITSITPTGYNSTDAPVTAVTSTQIKYAVASNPGAYSSGGTVTVGIGSPATGSLAVDVNGNLNLYGGSGWAIASTPWAISGHTLTYSAAGSVTSVGVQNTNSGGFAQLLLTNNTPQVFQLSIAGSATGAPFANAFYIFDATNSAIRLSIQSSGYVAIGPGVPSYVLDVTSGTGNTARFLDQTATTGATSVLIDIGAAQTSSSLVLTVNGIIKYGGSNSTGSGSAAFGSSNCPAVTVGSVYKWVKCEASDGSTCYAPIWK